MPSSNVGAITAITLEATRGWSYAALPRHVKLIDVSTAPTEGTI